MADYQKHKDNFNKYQEHIRIVENRLAGVDTRKKAE